MQNIYIVPLLYCLFFNIKNAPPEKTLRLMFRKHYSIRSCKTHHHAWLMSYVFKRAT